MNAEADNRGFQPGRKTWQAATVRAALAASEKFRSAQEIHADIIREHGEPVGLATIYRHLTRLADTGQADTLQTGDGETRYRLCETTTSHHHHLVCRNCGTTVEIEAEPIERWISNTADTNGFTDVDHTIEIFGLCRRCQPAAEHPAAHS